MRQTPSHIEPDGRRSTSMESSKMELTALSPVQQSASRRMVVAGIVVITVCYAGWQLAGAAATTVQHAQETLIAGADHHEHADDHSVHASAPPAFYSVLPFAALLLCIAILPLIHSTEEWWEHNWNRFIVAAGLGLVTLAYYVFLYPHGVVDHSSHAVSVPGWAAALVVLKNALLVEYIPFITLLFSLYVISGGIAIRADLVGTPKLNAGIIAIGGALASFIGTTGAAMLLIRPLIKANAKRSYVAHTVVFFIFVVCNTGGCLLPIGDPPLFLGYLRKVPFLWTLNLWPMFLVMNISLVAIYFAWDKIKYRREDHALVEAPPAEPQPFRVSGSVNFFWLICVILCVALLDPTRPVPGTHWAAPLYFREIAMLVFTALSLVTTSSKIRYDNSFSYDAILEVAALFVGIFICMQAPIQILNTYGPDLGFDTPAKFYWGTGILSAFLDNAPTYVVFFETAKTLDSTGETVAGIAVQTLVAISLGAVFMGAMTYIGNGPNFMVKAIAEKNNIRMPSFFGYMAYSCAVLLPLSIVLTLIFL
ncbi:MAG: sodium:proton antiporter [Planctomycetaceae bacterium]|nr:sodium:proton antiporter [Planctomycetaceae bacterium]